MPKLSSGMMRRSGVSSTRCLDPDHHRDARPVNVGVHQADAPSRRAHRERQVHRDRRFADAALAAGHREDVPHARDRAGDAMPGAIFGVLAACSMLHVDGRHARHRGNRAAHVFGDLRHDFGFALTAR